MGIILSAGGSLVPNGGPLLLGVLTRSPKPNSGSNVGGNNFGAQHQSGAPANKLTPVVSKQCAQQFPELTASAEKQKERGDAHRLTYCTSICN